MKTKSEKQTKSGLKSRPEQLSTETTTVNANGNTNGSATPAQPARILPFVNREERDHNRALPLDQVLALLRQWLPDHYRLAEIVGQWVWITFPEPPPEQVRGYLSQFGFHWNNLRKCWQHPCGAFRKDGSTGDPRTKYGSQMAPAADLKAA